MEAETLSTGAQIGDWLRCPIQPKVLTYCCKWGSHGFPQTLSSDVPSEKALFGITWPRVGMRLHSCCSRTVFYRRGDEIHEH
jgi:hypothetical protein